MRLFPNQPFFLTYIVTASVAKTRTISKQEVRAAMAEAGRSQPGTQAPAGSHIVLRRPSGRRPTIPNHRDLAQGTLRALRREAGMSKDPFVDCSELTALALSITSATHTQAAEIRPPLGRVPESAEGDRLPPGRPARLRPCQNRFDLGLLATFEDRLLGRTHPPAHRFQLPRNGRHFKRVRRFPQRPH